MNSFNGVSRVRVTANYPTIMDRTGTIRRRRINDEGAWVEMDKDLPEDLQSFSAEDTRFRHILLYPEDCEAAE